MSGERSASRRVQLASRDTPLRPHEPNAVQLPAGLEKMCTGLRQERGSLLETFKLAKGICEVLPDREKDSRPLLPLT